MTWRPNKYLIEGELDNTKPGKVTGWLRFAGLQGTVTVDLKGDFDRDKVLGQLARSRRASEEMERLVTDLLDISAIEAGNEDGTVVAVPDLRGLHGLSFHLPFVALAMAVRASRMSAQCLLLPVVFGCMLHR